MINQNSENNLENFYSIVENFLNYNYLSSEQTQSLHSYLQTVFDNDKEINNIDNEILHLQTSYKNNTEKFDRYRLDQIMSEDENKPPLLEEQEKEKKNLQEEINKEFFYLEALEENKENLLKTNLLLLQNIFKEIDNNSISNDGAVQKVLPLIKEKISFLKKEENPECEYEKFINNDNDINKENLFEDSVLKSLKMELEDDDDFMLPELNNEETSKNFITDNQKD